MSEHTPGPWKPPRLTIDEKAWFVGDPTGNFDIAIINCEHSPAGSAEANARLIAAAPDLLEACLLSQKVEEHLRSCKWCDRQTRDMCQDAIELAIHAEATLLAAIGKATKSR